MDRKDRLPILDPLLLILKQRTGMAFVITVIVLLVGYQAHVENEVLQLIGALAFTYIGGQKWVDSKEAAGRVEDVIIELMDDMKGENKEA